MDRRQLKFIEHQFMAYLLSDPVTKDDSDARSRLEGGLHEVLVDSDDFVSRGKDVGQLTSHADHFFVDGVMGDVYFGGGRYHVGSLDSNIGGVIGESGHGKLVKQVFMNIGQTLSVSDLVEYTGLQERTVIGYMTGLKNQLNHSSKHIRIENPRGSKTYIPTQIA